MMSGQIAFVVGTAKGRQNDAALGDQIVPRAFKAARQARGGAAEASKQRKAGKINCERECAETEHQVTCQSARPS